MELLLRGADVKYQSRCKNLPLHFAAVNNHSGVAEILMRSNADPSMPNGNGNIPVELTTDKTVKDILLRRRGSVQF